MLRLPPLFGLRTVVTLALVVIAGFPSILTVGARQIYVSANAAISLNPEFFNLFFSVDTSTQCSTTGIFTADSTETGSTATATGTITLTESGSDSRSGACTGTNAAVTFPASCTMTPTTLTCGSKTFTSSVDSSWQLSSTVVYKECSSSTNASQIRVNNTYMTLDFFANGCVVQQIPYVAQGGLVWMMGFPSEDKTCAAKQPTDPPTTPSPPGPPPTPSPPTRTGALFSATATKLCLQEGAVCYYTDCSAAGGGGGGATPPAATATPPAATATPPAATATPPAATATPPAATATPPAATVTPPAATATAPAATESPSSPSSSSTTIGIAVGVAVIVVVGVAAGVVLMRRRGSSAVRVTTSDMTSAMLVPQASPYAPPQQQQQHPAAQKGVNDFLL